MQFVYILKYNDFDLKTCSHRLVLSLKSLLCGRKKTLDDIEILIFNFSANCIKHELAALNKKVKYYHIRSDGKFSRARYCNHVVKHFVTSPFFYISDIDLIFPENFSNLLQEKITEYRDTSFARLVFLNGNLDSCAFPFKPKQIRLRDFLYQRPALETYQYDLLNRLPQRINFAHGCGVFNRHVFVSVRGFNEEFIGYGPEDGLYNARVKKISTVEYMPDIRFKTLHLWHKKFARYQVRENMQFYRSEIQKLNSLNNEQYDQMLNTITANIDRAWGEI